MSVFCILSMHLFVYSSDCVSVAHLDLGKILIFRIKSFLKIGNIFPTLLELLYLLIEAIELHTNISLSLREKF